IFTGIALENTGVPLPGESITLVGGFLAGQHELNYFGVVFSAFAGAVLGDNFGYWIGRWRGWPFLVRVGRFFRISEERLTKVRDRFGRNAVKAVLLGRFVTLLRIFAGPLAGITDMPYGRFLICNALGAAMWSFLMVSLAFFLGQVISLEQMVQNIAGVGILLLGALVVWIIVSIWLERRSEKAIDS
ncbi:MAG: DedA family protein, partial [Cyanobacteria bacterium P01_H01_bin.121]